MQSRPSSDCFISFVLSPNIQSYPSPNPVSINPSLQNGFPSQFSKKRKRKHREAFPDRPASKPKCLPQYAPILYLLENRRTILSPPRASASVWEPLSFLADSYPPVFLSSAQLDCLLTWNTHNLLSKTDH